MTNNTICMQLKNHNSLDSDHFSLKSERQILIMDTVSRIVSKIVFLETILITAYLISIERSLFCNIQRRMNCAAFLGTSKPCAYRRYKTHPQRKHHIHGNSENRTSSEIRNPHIWVPCIPGHKKKTEKQDPCSALISRDLTIDYRVYQENQLVLVKCPS